MCDLHSSNAAGKVSAKRLAGTPSVWLTGHDQRLVDRLTSKPDLGPTTVLQIESFDEPHWTPSPLQTELLCRLVTAHPKTVLIVCGQLVEDVDRTPSRQERSFNRSESVPPWLQRCLHAHERLRNLERRVIAIAEFLGSFPKLASLIERNQIFLRAMVYRFDCGSFLIHQPNMRRFVPIQEAVDHGRRPLRTPRENASGD
jgi:hypothetical protein